MSDKPDIAAVLRYYGADDVPENYRYRPMLCPFHDERNASASVNTDEGKFRCFVCDIKGDAIDVVKWRENLEYLSAVGFLEGTIGISCDGLSSVASKPSARRPVFGESRPNERGSAKVPNRVRRKPRPWA